MLLKLLYKLASHDTNAAGGVKVRVATLNSVSNVKYNLRGGFFIGQN